MAAHRPVGGADYPRSRQEFDDWFPDDAACIEYLAALRWPGGFICPSCGDDRSWRTSVLSWICTQCGRKTSVTAGTIFHRSHAPLSTWFAAIWHVTSERNGVSARELQRALGLGSYETAWAWLQKLRRAMVRPGSDLLAGTVELAQTHVDCGRPTPVLVAVERMTPQRLGRVRFGVADNGHDPVAFASETIAPGSTIRGAADQRRLECVGYLPERSEAPGVQLVASDLKRWLAGTLGQHVGRKHLPYYLDEFAFRFDRRGSTARGLLFYVLLQRAVTTMPHPRAELGNGHRT
jgi:transposase-like protein